MVVSYSEIESNSLLLSLSDIEVNYSILFVESKCDFFNGEIKFVLKIVFLYPRVNREP